MAFISIQQMYDTWKKVSDWVSGASGDSPKVELTGSYGGYSYEDKDTIAPNAKRDDDFLEWDTGKYYIYDGEKWVLFA